MKSEPGRDHPWSAPHLACPTCGYDLRGDRSGGVCPECATPKALAMERAAESPWARLLRTAPSLAARVGLSLVLCGMAFIVAIGLLGLLADASEEAWGVALAVGILAACITAAFEVTHLLIRRRKVAIALFATILAAWVGFLLHVARDPGELAEIPFVVAVTSAILGAISAGLHHLPVRRQVQLAIGLAVLLVIVVVVA